MNPGSTKSINPQFYEVFHKLSLLTSAGKWGVELLNMNARGVAVAPMYGNFLGRILRALENFKMYSKVFLILKSNRRQCRFCSSFLNISLFRKLGWTWNFAKFTQVILV